MRFFYILLLTYVFTNPLLAQKPQNGFQWLEQDPKSLIQEDNLEIPVVSFKGLLPLLNQNDGKIRVINFWATWCAPCIKELPYFEEAAKTYAENGVEVILVSLDFPSMWETRLPAFVKKKEISSPVVVLDDPDQNSWIPKVDPQWSGAIPATLIYTADDRQFYEQTFDRASLKEAIESFIH